MTEFPFRSNVTIFIRTFPSFFYIITAAYAEILFIKSKKVHFKHKKKTKVIFFSKRKNLVYFLCIFVVFSMVNWYSETM